MSDAISLAAALAGKLDYTTEDLEGFCEREGNERFADCPNNLAVLREVDRIEFQCAFCSYWKPQRENATLNASQWYCLECVRGGDVQVS